MILAFAITSNFKVCTASASIDKEIYAKIQTSDCVLYETPQKTSPICTLRKTFFVQVEEKSGDFYKVSYNGISGYVSKDKVSLMDGTPSNKYFSATVKLFSPTYPLYEKPSESSSEVTTLSRECVMTYYGYTQGQTASNSDNNIWYYLSVNQGGKTLYGYVFSQAVAGENPEANAIDNVEDFPVIDESIFTDATSSFSGLSVGTKIMLVIAICVPSLLILYFLIKPSKIAQSPKKKTKHKVQHGDYFEFDESEL